MDSDKKKKLTVIAWSAGAVIVIAAAVTTYILTRPVKVPDPQSGQDARAFLASDNFRKLTPQQQSDFVRRMRPAKRPTPADMQKMRQEMQKMSPEQRRNMRDNMRRVFMREQEKRLDEFFKKSKAEQIAELDRRIAEQNKRRAERQRNRQQRQQRQPNNNPPAAANNTQNAAAGNQNTATAQNQSGNAPRRFRPSAQMRREFESAISPSARAKFQQYRQMERMRREGKLK